MSKYIYLILLLVSPFAWGEELRGAFGLLLGDQYEPGGAPSSSLTDGTPMYSFKPDHPYRAFTRYFVTITPRSSRISRIWAIGEQENDPTCDKERAVIKTIISNKYGGEWSEPLLSNDHIWTSGKKSVGLKCEGFGDVSIQIIYRDSDITDLEEQERIQLEAEKVDSQGL